MKRFFGVAAISAALMVSFAPAAAAQNVTPAHTNLKVGDMAPDFTLPSTQGGSVTLSSFRGKNVVVLAFFPAAFTGGWTKEMLAYQAGIAKFEGNNVKVFAISADNTPSQKEFGKQVNAAFPMLSDFATRDTLKKYGVYIEKYGFANRATFVVDEDGKIANIEEGNSALDPTGADTACSRLAHKKQ